MTIAGLFVCYFIAALAGILLDKSNIVLTSIWIANALAVVLWLRWKALPPATNLATLFAGIAAANLVSGHPFDAGLLLAGANVLEAATSMVILNLLSRQTASLNEMTRSTIILFVVGLIAPLVGAALAAFGLNALDGLAIESTWPTWAAGSLLGAMIVLPTGLSVDRTELKALKQPSKLALVAIYLLATVAIGVLALRFMRFPFVGVALPVLFASATLRPFQTSLTSIAAIATVIFSSEAFQRQGEVLHLPVQVDVAIAFACLPPYLFSLLRAQLRQSEARLAASERLFRTAMDNSAIGMAIVSAQGHLQEANRRFGEYLGYGREELRHIDFRDITLPEDLAMDEALVGDLLSGARDHYELEKRYVRKDGTVVWGLLAVSIIRASEPDEADYFVSQIVDIDGRKRSEATQRSLNQQLFDEKERLRITLYSIGDAVITTDQWARITFLNPVAERLTGWSRGEAEGKPLSEIFDLVVEATGERIASPVDECLARGQPYYLQDGAALIARDGKLVSIQDSAAPVRGPDGVIHGAVLVFQDVSKTRSLQRELLFTAMHDSLTMLPNRRAFEHSLQASCSTAGNRSIRHVVGYVDLDRFKLINDTAGHAAGDAVLKEVARLLKSLVRKDDIVARLGGDEFGLILFDCTVEQAQTVAEKLIAGIRSNVFHWESRSYELGASIGLAEISGNEIDASELLVQADIACYAAKTSGRNRAVAYHGQTHEALKHRRDMDIATTLRSAIEQGRFRLFAQEIFPLDVAELSPRIFELFVRLVDMDGNFIGPAEFIPAAERYNLMNEVDRWVIETAFRTCGGLLRANENLRIALNISANSLECDNIWEFVAASIEENGIPANQLFFEITETAVMSNIGAAMNFVSKAQEKGIGIALDDFGVGMSSFSYLKLFKADKVKIDASFVRDMAEIGRDRQIIKAIVELGRALGIATVAEGVESQAQVDLLRTLGVSMGQGYYWTRPAPIEIVLPFTVDRQTLIGAAG